MKDYSKYFENPEAFIKSIRRVGDKIEVTFANNVVNQYLLNQENLEFFYEQLEMQYQEVSKNWNKINKTKKTSLNISVILLSILVGTLSIFGGSNLSLPPDVIAALAKGTIITLPLVDAIIIGTSNKKINKHGVLLKNLLANLDEMETVLDEQEFNIKRGLSASGIHALKVEKSLVEDNYIENSININLLDKWSQKEQENIYRQYKINEGLKVEPKVLVKTRTPDKK